MKKAGRFRWRAAPSIATPPCLKPSLGEALIAGISKRRRKSAVGMAMEFSRVISPVEDMEIWNASGGGFSFVISYESRSGPGCGQACGRFAGLIPEAAGDCIVLPAAPRSGRRAAPVLLCGLVVGSPCSCVLVDEQFLGKLHGAA
jgi:hypothetical protein